jgi:hypothetical protein
MSADQTDKISLVIELISFYYNRTFTSGRRRLGIMNTTVTIPDMPFI